MLSYEELYEKFSAGKPWAGLMRTTCLELARTDSVGTIEPESKLLDLVNHTPTAIPIVTAWSIVAGFRSPITGKVVTRTAGQFQRVSNVVKALRIASGELVGIDNERLVVAVFLQYRKHLTIPLTLNPRNQYEHLVYSGLYAKDPSYTVSLVWLFESLYRSVCGFPDPVKVLDEPYLKIYRGWLRK